MTSLAFIAGVMPLAIAPAQGRTAASPLVRALLAARYRYITGHFLRSSVFCTGETFFAGKPRRQE